MRASTRSDRAHRALAAQLARWGGAAVIGTVRRAGDLQRVKMDAIDRRGLDQPDPAAAVRSVTPAEVDRIVEVNFSAVLLTIPDRHPDREIN